MILPKFRAWSEEGRLMYYDVFPFRNDSLLLSYDEIAFDEVPASDFVLMQSTGVFDSSLEPVEIFKDDIVTKSLPNGAVLVGVVTFTKGMFLVDDVEAIDQSWVVIGNIHQHQHLLEELGDG